MLWKKMQAEKAQIRMPEILLEGERIFLRPPEAKDYESWKSVRGANRIFLKPFEPTWPENCLSHDFFRRRLIRQAKDWKAEKSRHFLIFRQNDKSLIGGININYIHRGVAQSGALGYWLDEKQQGQGYMAETLIFILSYAFTDMGLNRVNAATLLDNERSRKLLEGAGFTREGTAKSYMKIDGRFQDHILYAMCKEDWMDLSVSL